MTEEGKFWCNIWCAAFIMVIMVVLLISVTSIIKAQMLTEMVGRGANPLDASCAMYGSPADEGSTCLLRMEKTK